GPRTHGRVLESTIAPDRPSLRTESPERRRSQLSPPQLSSSPCLRCSSCHPSAVHRPALRDGYVSLTRTESPTGHRDGCFTGAASIVQGLRERVHLVIVGAVRECSHCRYEVRHPFVAHHFRVRQVHEPALDFGRDGARTG